MCRPAAAGSWIRANRQPSPLVAGPDRATATATATAMDLVDMDLDHRPGS